MKRYRPKTKTIVIGLAFMIVGILCWCLFAPFKANPHLIFLLPLGLLLVCIGGLELTITAFLTLRKNDLAMRAAIKKQKEEEAKQKGAAKDPFRKRKQFGGTKD